MATLTNSKLFCLLRTLEQYTECKGRERKRERGVGDLLNAFHLFVGTTNMRVLVVEQLMHVPGTGTCNCPNHSCLLLLLLLLLLPLATCHLTWQPKTRNQQPGLGQ